MKLRFMSKAGLALLAAVALCVTTVQFINAEGATVTKTHIVTDTGSGTGYFCDDGIHSVLFTGTFLVNEITVENQKGSHTSGIHQFNGSGTDNIDGSAYGFY